MNEKRNKSDEPNLSLSLKTPIEYESINNIPTLEEAVNLELKNGQVDPNVNMKKLRRTISNRLSAQRTRMRKIEYTDRLKREAKNLEEEPVVEIVQNEELKAELKRLKEPTKALEDEEYMDMDQYLNFDNMNFSPSKNDGI
ncbi:hypothetical protein EJD97_024149 [Solanum chilense]|uniref:BZIP domain-containing protein n=1 Tax=Solanum chilense TaxID=4083 RepID=A0A6N2AR21_SOLCI|nr:hypothetical protein EJD97_024149 [Solanum chilense]